MICFCSSIVTPDFELKKRGVNTSWEFRSFLDFHQVALLLPCCGNAVAVYLFFNTKKTMTKVLLVWCLASRPALRLGRN